MDKPKYFGHEFRSDGNIQDLVDKVKTFKFISQLIQSASSILIKRKDTEFMFFFQIT